LLESRALLAEPLLKLLLRRKLELITSHEDIAVSGGCEAHILRVAFGAKQYADRRVLVGICDVLGQIVDIVSKLPRMLGLEWAEFDFGAHETSQSPMVEEQVDVAVPAAYGDPELPSHEAEVTAQLEQERSSP